ncbi:hypothetical protein [Roseibium sp.]|uniref:hypothetical protein n=1 Tax=Roseibium sp. TaxID=1936156 RepID=UPI003A97ECC5
MNVCILVGSSEQLKNAGVRIRYERLKSALAPAGHHLDIVPISKFSRLEHFRHDIYVFSKCYDAGSLVIAHHLRASGIPIGVDLFDDWFSHATDSRFTRYRSWLGHFLKLANFVLAASGRIRGVMEAFGSTLPFHVINDPFAPDFSPARLIETLNRKQDEVVRTGRIRVLWFGIGDNPHFPVGLQDLVAFSDMLAEMRERGLEIRLDILTNRRAMTPERLEMLKRLPVPYELSTWSVQRERDMLNASTASFLPVNYQAFSITKSLNRAVTALCAGSQVLSAGYPLYDRLAPFVYRNAQTFLRDAKSGSMALRETTVPAFTHLLAGVASPAGEAEKLVTFLDRIDPGEPDGKTIAMTRPLAAVIHGSASSWRVHRLAKKLSALSVASPFCGLPLDWDISFADRNGERGPEILLSGQCMKLLGADAAKNFVPVKGGFFGTRYSLSLAQLLPDFSARNWAQPDLDSSLALLTTQPSTIRTVIKAIQALFPGLPCVYSEKSRLPLVHNFDDRLSTGVAA